MERKSRNQRQMDKTWRALTLVAVVVALCTGKARSEIVRIGIEGEVSYVDGYSPLLNDLFTVGDPVSGEYVYEADPGPGNTKSGVRDYWFRSGPYGINLTVGDFTIQSDPDNLEFLIEILNDWRGEDAYGVRSYNNLPLSTGLAVDMINWQLLDYSGTALSGTSLLSEAPVLSDWPDHSGMRISLGYKGSLTLGTRISSVTVVPEPATVLLLALGALAMFRRTGR
ncbi:MAG: PEP-CTERM sorting domain-containing protein [Phycisphaerae bacterium]|nr:PEP-CTERM sorting domain-containing protein [Phycisphaerae bacterium]